MNYGDLIKYAQQLLIIPQTNETQLTAIIQQEINTAQRKFVQNIYIAYKDKPDGFSEIGRILGDQLVTTYSTLTVAGQTRYDLMDGIFYLINVFIDGKRVNMIDYQDIFLQENRWTQLPSNQHITARWSGNQLVINPAQINGLPLLAEIIVTPTAMTTSDLTVIPQIDPTYHERLAYYAAAIATGRQLAESRNPNLTIDRFMEGLIEPNAINAQ